MSKVFIILVELKLLLKTGHNNSTVLFIFQFVKILNIHIYVSVEA